MVDLKYQSDEILVFNLKAERKNGLIYMCDGIKHNEISFRSTIIIQFLKLTKWYNMYYFVQIFINFLHVCWTLNDLGPLVLPDILLGYLSKIMFHNEFKIYIYMYHKYIYIIYHHTTLRD